VQLSFEKAAVQLIVLQLLRQNAVGLFTVLRFCLLQTAVEIANYLTAPAVSCGDVLAFWRGNSASRLYPQLCQLALLHLSSSASTVPVECMFSVAGLIANSKRSSLTADKLHRICFIHDNYSLAF